MKAKVITKFYDIECACDREAGTSFECTAERFADIDGKLPGYIEKAATPRKEEAKPKE